MIPDDFQITIELGPCYGHCPVYSMTVFANGTVEYFGEMFVEVWGPQTASLSMDEIRALFYAIELADFFTLKDSYTVPVTDLPSADIMVTMEGRTKRVSHYGLECKEWESDAPLELCAIEDLLMNIPIANGWVAEDEMDDFDEDDE